MNLSLKLGCSLWVLAVLTPAPSLAQYCGPPCKQKGIEEKVRAKYLDPANQACKATFSLAFDWKSFDEDKLKQWDQYNTEAICGEPLRQLGLICGAAAGQKVAKSRVKGLECRWSKTAEKAELSLKSGLLIYAVAFQRSKHYLFVQQQLEKLLGYKYPFKVEDPY